LHYAVAVQQREAARAGHDAQHVFQVLQRLRGLWRAGGLPGGPAAQQHVQRVAGGLDLQLQHARRHLALREQLRGLAGQCAVPLRVAQQVQPPPSASHTSAHSSHCQPRGHRLG
jgi:hypothetical protein